MKLLKIHLGTQMQLYCFILSITKLTLTPQQVKTHKKVPHKKNKKKEKNRKNRNTRNKMKQVMEKQQQYVPRHDIFIVFICSKKRVHEIFLKSKLQIMQVEILVSLLGFKNYFLTYSALQTFVPPDLCLLLHLSLILNIFNVSFSSSLNRLNTLSLCQIFAQICNA